MLVMIMMMMMMMMIMMIIIMIIRIIIMMITHRATQRSALVPTGENFLTAVKPLQLFVRSLHLTQSSQSSQSSPVWPDLD